MQPRETLSSASTVAMATRSAMAAVGERGREGEGARWFGVVGETAEG